MKKKLFMTAFLSMLGRPFAFAAISFTQTDDARQRVEDHEIKVNIQFDLDEDIGLFLID